ncbi:hypothetical protein PR202_ga18148 [Eleusine coracana subsp. coracana]|uniref:mitogen-activated protein kinase kinase n=1 Tax=Eleusine coracana subsp. coracana TaxID=191504 RepID=A0AAV5CSC1_ELECO|nr:hypothetical protein PR202_ga18148 [Eleusine coracana subsp. coracana]
MAPPPAESIASVSCKLKISESLNLQISESLNLLAIGWLLNLKSVQTPERTQSGTFRDGDLLVNRDGLSIVSQNEEGEAPPIKPLDNQLSLDDLDAIKVIGKGNGGIVQLVRHKWTGQFFALKVIQLNIQEDIRRQIAQELKISLSTQCPYVVRCYQCFYVNGAISIVLEYMDGGSLSDFLKTVKTIPEFYLAAICKQASDVLQKDVRDRSSAQILLGHPFLSMYDDLNVDLASYFTTAGSPLATFETLFALLISADTEAWLLAFTHVNFVLVALYIRRLLLSSPGSAAERRARIAMCVHMLAILVAESFIGDCLYQVILLWAAPAVSLGLNYNKLAGDFGK